MKKVVFLISFFAYSGYYAGLAIIFSLNLSSLSRYYSVPLRLILALAMIYFITQSDFNVVNKKKVRLIIIFLLFWFFYFAKVLFTESGLTTIELSRPWYEYIFFVITYVMIPFITFTILNFEQYKKTILDGFIFSGFILGLVSLSIYGSVLGSGIGRISNLSYETGKSVLSPLALSYGGSLTMALCTFKLWIEKEASKFQKIYLLIALTFGFIIFLLGSSRGSIVSILLSILVLLGYSRIKGRFKIIVLTIISTPIIIWAIEASKSSIIKRTQNLSSDGWSGRDALWQNALNHFIDNPIFGGQIEIGGIHPHNFIIEVLMATGIVGAFLVFPLVFRACYRGLKIRKEDIFIFLIFVHGFVMHLFTGALWGAILLFMPMGIILTYSFKSPSINGQ